MNSRKKKRMRKRRNPFFRCKGKSCRIKAEHQVHLDGALDVVCRLEDVPSEIGYKNGAAGKIEEARTPNESIVKAVFYAITVSALASAFLSSNDTHTIKASTVNVYGSLVIGSCGGEAASDSGRWMIPLAYFLFFTGYFYDEWRAIKIQEFKAHRKPDKVRDGNCCRIWSLILNIIKLLPQKWLAVLNCLYKIIFGYKRYGLRKIVIKSRRNNNMLVYNNEIFEVLAWMIFIIQATTISYFEVTLICGIIGCILASFSLLGHKAQWTIVGRGWLMENLVWCLCLIAVLFGDAMAVEIICLCVATMILIGKLYRWFNTPSGDRSRRNISREMELALQSDH